MAKSPSKKSKSPSKRMQKEKFFDLIQKKVFYTTDYQVMYRTMNSKNGKRKVTYHVTVNPTAKKDGKTFKNWKIISNVAV